MRSSPRTRNGISLVIMVVALAVIFLLILALLRGARHQGLAAQSNASIAREKLLADSAVALVIGQVTQASTPSAQAWISQPGLVRTYDTTSSRKPTACYKLYSTPSLAAMVDTSGTLTFLADDVPTDWATRPSEFTDLNAPAVNASGQIIYPILDSTAPTAVSGVSIDSGHDVSMPAAWLYEFQDGSFGPVSQGTSLNPIVARLAFWTDDETSKININTAGAGAPWNTPRFNSVDDVAWSTTQPANGEFSAYSGHPATTSLAEVFSSLTPQQLLGLTPRYAWGGSQFGTVATTAGQTLAVKMDRLYASLDELVFGSAVDASGQREANPLTATQINAARFVLTAHSVAPETTLLGEPRIAIWPVADSSSATAPRITATDRAVISAATVGARSYYFQRHNAQSATDDLDAAIVPSNAQLFGDLVARGSQTVPGYGTAFTATKYPGAAWTQLMLEITDSIRSTNSVDPASSPFVPFAAGDASGVGRAFVIPLITTYGSGATQAICRGLDRCPTLSSLTLVFYVCGFGFKDGTFIDYDATPDDASGTSWNANFAVATKTNRWKQVTSELVRAFVVPCTFQPGCGYPEVSDACDIEIDGLDGITVSSATTPKSTTGDFGFPAVAHSRLLSDALSVLPADRSWGGNEGPAAWRAAALDAMATGAWSGYPFAGTKSFAITPLSGVTDAATGGPSLPASWARTLTFNGVNGLTVKIRDRNGNTLQTLSVNLPTCAITHSPTINGECDHADGSTPATAHTDWASNSACAVAPSWYMNLRNRVLATQNSRAAFIQAGDITRGVEANADLRVVAGLASVPASFFSPLKAYATSPQVNAQGGSHAHNIRFPDGTSACFAPYNNSNSSANDNCWLVSTGGYPKALSTLISATDWQNKAKVAYYQYTSPACSVPTGTKFVAMSSGVLGDWDTGPGFSPDGAQINFPDSGTTLSSSSAYFSLTGGQVGASTQRAPNALVPSPVVFGSLPAGINPAAPASSVPWRTLLFCPYPAANTTGAPYTSHPGAASPPDHLILDNFWMPVIEPYAISTCMATAGKINLNDQIAPFTYLHRSTALRALLNSVRLPAVSATKANAYKSSGTAMPSVWNKIDPAATLAQIESRFANNSADAYLSESEICTVPLVPSLSPSPFSNDVAATQSALSSYWSGATFSDGALTGDNLRELPYAQLYGRLTTRSNSYTVHLRVQILKKLPRDPNQKVWNEQSDVVLGDWRGSYEIERYLDPSAVAPVAGTALGRYKFRTVSARQFAP